MIISLKISSTISEKCFTENVLRQTSLGLCRPNLHFLGTCNFPVCKQTLAHFRGHSALLHQMVNMCRGKTEDVRVFVRDILIFMMGKAFNVIIPVTDDLKTAILRISDISIYFMMKSLRITFRFRVKKRMKPDKRGRKSPYTFKEKSSLCIYPA